jgi:hypothetical protein
VRLSFSSAVRCREGVARAETTPGGCAIWGRANERLDPGLLDVPLFVARGRGASFCGIICRDAYWVFIDVLSLQLLEVGGGERCCASAKRRNHQHSTPMSRDTLSCSQEAKERKKKILNRVGFEPTSISTLAPEASALDRSAICPDEL